MSKREVLARAIDRSGLRPLLGRSLTWNGLLTFNYHRIGEAVGSPFDRGLWSATAEQFEQQVRFLATNFDPVGVEDLDLVLRGGAGRFVMITFDDGYRDNHDIAFPILRSCGTTATFFLATGFLDRPHNAWWDEIAWMVRASQRVEIAPSQWLNETLPLTTDDRESVIRRLLRIYKGLTSNQTSDFLDWLADASGSGRCPPTLAAREWMTWSMAREMSRGGMSIGGHTVNHPVLANLSVEEQRAEIVGCRDRIEQELGFTPQSFSYPVGGPTAFDDRTQRCLTEAGLRWAFSYYGGFARRGHKNPLDLPRHAIEPYVSLSEFRTLTSLPQWFA